MLIREDSVAFAKSFLNVDKEQNDSVDIRKKCTEHSRTDRDADVLVELLSVISVRLCLIMVAVYLLSGAVLAHLIRLHL